MPRTGTNPLLRPGFTLLELLAVVAVIAILAAIFLPTMASAKASAYKERCMSNIHQNWLATSLYRENQSSHADFGTPYEMGLPPISTVPSGWVDQDCRGQLVESHVIPGGTFLLDSPPESALPVSWAEYTAAYHDNSVYIVDVAHNDADLWKRGIYKPVTFAFGVAIGGQAVSRRRPTSWALDAINPWWWHDDFDKVMKLGAG